MVESEKNQENNSKIAELEKTAESQANTIATLENEVKKLGDPNKTPRIIQKGSQRHPKYQRNNTIIAATMPKPEIPEILKD